MENPNQEERESFFAPLFLDGDKCSVRGVLKNINVKNKLCHLNGSLPKESNEEKKDSVTTRSACASGTKDDENAVNNRMHEKSKYIELMGIYKLLSTYSLKSVNRKYSFIERQFYCPN